MDECWPGCDLIDPHDVCIAHNGGTLGSRCLAPGNLAKRQRPPCGVRNHIGFYCLLPEGHEKDKTPHKFE